MSLPLFPQGPSGGSAARPPLAERMRPRALDDVVGQSHLIGEGKVLRRMIEADELRSIILWGPPGTGKTTLARLIAAVTKAPFVAYSAVLSGIKEIKGVMADAERVFRSRGARTILFVDEIHRFNKAQQDAFLPYVESGVIVLVGATTENPSFELIPALLSRAKVYVLNPLDPDEIAEIARRALEDSERGLGKSGVEAEPETLRRLAVYSGGDARVALNALEIAVTIAGERAGVGRATLTVADLEGALQRKTLLYDKAGEEHFNLISALHKSLRNSDCDASLYWLVRMIESGEDPVYVARRMVRFASEDVGMADPRALAAALDAVDAVRLIGLPECVLALAQAAVYLALAPKSNALYLAWSEAAEDVASTMAEPVPLSIRNAPTGLMRDLGYGKGYQYAHDLEEKVADMECLPDSLRGRRYYHPTGEGLERRLRERIEEIRARREKGDG